MRKTEQPLIGYRRIMTLKELKEIYPTIERDEDAKIKARISTQRKTR